MANLVSTLANFFNIHSRSSGIKERMARIVDYTFLTFLPRKEEMEEEIRRNNKISRRIFEGPR